jgi:predicted double-glycine peptidase
VDCSTPTGGPLNAEATIRLGFGGGPFFAKVRTWKSIKEERIVMQSSDYSCGAAALATLLTYHFQDDVGEAAVMDGILTSLSAADKKDRQSSGFSLLDLSDFLAARGYEAMGFRLTLAGLHTIHLPALVLLSVEGDKHFVILTEIRGDRIYLADSSRGNLRLSVDAFAREWTNIALVVTRPGIDGPKSAPADPDREVVLDRMLSAYRSTVRERP